MAINTAMTILSVVLIGGTILFPDDRVHQVLGMALLALWLVHTVLHRAWYASLFKGKYPPYRVIQVVVNGGISVCALLLMASGLMMAWFVPSELVSGSLGFARTAHLVGSHWYYLFMCTHLGMHIGMISRIALQSSASSTLQNSCKIIVLRIVLALVRGGEPLPRKSAACNPQEQAEQQ